MGKQMCGSAKDRRGVEGGGGGGGGGGDEIYVN